MSDYSKGTTLPPRSFAGLPVCTRLEELEADIAISGLTAATGAQLIISFIGTMARSGRIGVKRA